MQLNRDTESRTNTNSTQPDASNEWVHEGENRNWGSSDDDEDNNNEQNVEDSEWAFYHFESTTQTKPQECVCAPPIETGLPNFKINTHARFGVFLDSNWIGCLLTVHFVSFPSMNTKKAWEYTLNHRKEENGELIKAVRWLSEWPRWCTLASTLPFPLLQYNRDRYNLTPSQHETKSEWWCYPGSASTKWRGGSNRRTTTKTTAVVVTTSSIENMGIYRIAHSLWQMTWSHRTNEHDSLWSQTPK